MEMYPAPFVIKNTFIDGQVSRNPSFDAFYHERAAHSCPNSKLVAQGVSVDEEKATVTPISSQMSGVSSPISYTKESVFVEGRLFEQPVSFRNTFVHFPVDRPVSLESFINERHARSCPSSGVGLTEGKIQADVDAEGVSQINGHTAFSPHESHLLTRDLASAAQLFDQPRVVLSLAASVAEPISSFSGLPSVGSAGHHLGTCKPCAFTIKGCASGGDCPFCHLCDPSEKKRRRKEKATFLKGLSRLRKQVASGDGVGWMFGA